MRDSQASGKKPINEVEKLRARVAILESENRKLTKSSSADEELGKAWAEWEKTFDGARDSIMVIDSEFKISQANLATSHLLGKPVDEIVGQTCWQVVHGTEEPPEKCPLKAALYSKNHEEMELHVPEKDIWIEVSTDPILDEQGNINRAIHIIRDITERKRAERLLQRERDNAQKYLDVAGVMLVAIDVEQRVGLINRKGCEILGYSEEEILAKNWFDNFLPERIRDEVRTVLERLVAGEPDAPEYYENPILTKNGDERLIAWHNTILRDENGEIIAALSSGEDITERKKAGKELARALAWQEAIFEGSRDAVFISDADSRFVTVNRAACELTGHSKQELLRMRIPDLHKEKDLAAYNLYHGRIMAGEEIVSEAKILRKDGTNVDTEFNNRCVKISGRTYMHTVAREITERKKTEEQIAKLAKFPAEDPYPVLRISGYGTVVYSNKAGAPLLKVWGCRVGESLPDRWCEFVLDALSSGQSQRAEVECDGRIFFLTFAPVTDANYVNVYGLDITERKKAEENLRESRDYLERLTNSMWDAVFSVKMPERIIEWANDSFKLIGYEPEEYIGSTTEFLYAHKSEFLDFGNKLASAITAGEDILHAEQLLKRKSGEVFPAEITTTIYKEKGEVLNVTSIVRDITERKKAEDRLLEDQAKLKSSTSELFLAEERERRRIAEGIHDDIGNKLAVAKFELESLKKGPADSEIPALLERVSATMDKVIEDAHSLTFELSNPVLYEVGLDAAVESWLGRHIHKKSRLKYEVVSEPSPMKPDEETKVVLFRVIRELLSNVIKHADASMVQVHIKKDDETIRVSIEDDGVGFEMSEPGLLIEENGGFGLFNTRERVEYVGGSFEIESEPGQGTFIKISVPVQKRTFG